MNLFGGDRKRREKEMARDLRFKQGLGRVRRYIEQCEASRAHSSAPC